MALVLKDRVRETSTTTGTGTFTLAGAVAGFQSFSAIGTGNSTYYTIVSTSDWEVGIGTWTSPDQLSRDTVLASTNAGALVTFGSGTKDVFLTFPAEGFAVPPAIGSATPNTITGTDINATTSLNVYEGSQVLFVIDKINVLGSIYPQITAYDDSGNITNTTFTTGLSVGSNALSYAGNLTLQGPTPSIVIGDATASGNYLTLATPSTFTSSYTLKFPTSSGSNNQVLKTDGSGNLSWLDFGSPPAIGSTTPNTGAFTTLTTTGAVTTTSVSDPSAPANGNLSIYAKSFGGNVTLAARNALNKSFGLQSALWSKNFQIWTTTNATNGLWLNASGTGSGTYTNVNPTAGATVYQSCRRSTYANVITTTNQLLGVANGQASFFRGSTAGLGGFFYYAKVGFDVWTNGGRFFAGMATGTTVVTAGDPSALNNTVGFCVDAADAGAISFLTRGTAATKASTGFTIVSNKGYECYIYCSPNSSQYTWQIIDINTGTSASGTATLNLPTNTTMQAPEALASNAALTPATSISIGVCKVYVESDN